MNTKDPMTQQQLDAIQEREAKATAGPWGVEGPAQCGPGDTLVVYPVEDGGTLAYVQPSWDDAEFIAHARQDVPALLAEVERLRARLTVDDEAVERAIREQWGSRWWDEMLASEDDYDVALVQTYRDEMRDILNAALGTKEGA